MSNSDKSKQLVFKIISVVSVLLFILILIWSLPVTDWLNQFNNWVKDLGPIGFVVFSLTYIILTVLLIPGSVLTIGGGFIFGLIPGFLTVSFSATMGACLSFLIGRYFARDKVANKVEQNPKFKVIDSAIGKQGGKIIFLLRLTPVVPFALSNYFYGITAVKFSHYALASWIGMIPGTLLYVYLGHIGKTSLDVAAGSGTPDTLKNIVTIIGLFATLAVTIYVTKVAKKALKETDLDNQM